MTTKEKKGSNVPNLRFPGFTEPWEERKLEKVVKINQGLQIAISERLMEMADDAHFYITNEFLKKNSVKRYFIKNPPKSVLCTKEDILMTRTGNTGMVVTNVAGAFHNNFFKVAYPEYIVKDFLYHFLKLTTTQREIIKLAGTSTIPDLNHSDFYKIKFTFPKKTEQTKIAYFVSLIDSRISTQSKIIRELELLKKTVSKKIFTKQLRLKNNLGNSYPEWKTLSLGEIGKTYGGLTGKTKEDFGAGKPYIQYKQIFDQSKIDISRCDLVTINDKESQAKVKKGDVLFTVSSETPEEIGMSSVLLDEVEEVYLNSFCFGYRPKSVGILLPSFARYLFRSDVIRNEIIKLAQGSTRYNMSKIALMKLKINLPSKEEQSQIGVFLTVLDDKISIEQNLLKKLKQQKQYLLSNLFI